MVRALVGPILYPDGTGVTGVLRVAPVETLVISGDFVAMAYVDYDIVAGALPGDAEILGPGWYKFSLRVSDVEIQCFEAYVTGDSGSVSIYDVYQQTFEGPPAEESGTTYLTAGSSVLLLAPGGGTDGQVLTRTATAMDWEDPQGGAEVLNDLTDVVITSAASGEYLRHNGTNWVDGVIAAGDLPTGIDAVKIADGSVSNTEFQRLDGLTGNIQTQLDGKASSSHTHTLDDLTDVVITAGASGEYIRYNGTNWVDAVIAAGDLPTGIDAVKIADGSVSNTEFQRLDGLTGNIQTQLDGKASSSHTHTLDDLTDVVITAGASGEYIRYNGTNWVDAVIAAGDLPTGIDAVKIADGSVSNTEFQRLDGLTGNIQTQLDGKASSSHTHTLDDLTDVVITAGASGEYLRHNGTNWVDGVIAAGDLPTGIDAVKIGAGSVSNTELGYLDGVTSAIQTQLDGKSSTSHTHTLNDLSDVVITSVATDQTIVWDGSNWVNGRADAKELQGITVTSSPTANHVLTYNGTTWTSAFVSDALIAVGSIYGNKLVDNTVTNGKLSDNSVQFEKMRTITGPTVMGKFNAGSGEITTLTPSTSGHVLTYNGTAIVWAAPGSASIALDDLTDVVITAAASGEYLRHNGTNWVDGVIAAGDLPTGIDAAKIADGSVSNTEFQYVNGVTSAIQTQLDGKAASSHNHAASDVTSGTLAVNRGGTNVSSYTKGDLLIASASTTLTKLAVGTDGQVLTADAAETTGVKWATPSGGGATNLDGLTDVVITSAASGEYLRHNGTNWVDGVIAAGDLPTGIDAAKIADGSVSNTEFQYVNGVTSAIQTQLDGKASSSHSHAIDDLSDVTISSVASNELLRYNGSAWVNSQAETGSIATSAVTTAKIADGAVTWAKLDAAVRRLRMAITLTEAVSSASKVELAAWTVPANAMGDKDRIELMGTIDVGQTSGSSNNLSWYIRVDGVDYQFGSTVGVGNGAAHKFDFKISIWRIGNDLRIATQGTSVDSSSAISVYWASIGSNVDLYGGSYRGLLISGTGVIDYTADLDIALVAQWGTSSGSSSVNVRSAFAELTEFI